jgi:hypothetical protein
VKELEQFCQSRGLSITGLKKAQLVQLLVDSEDEQNVASVKASNVNVNNTDLVELGNEKNAIDSDVCSDVDIESDVDGDDDDVVLSASSNKTSSDGNLNSLKLQIKLAELELAKMKLQANMSDNNCSADENKTKVDRSIKSLLPQMSNSSDCLSFFHVFERPLEMQLFACVSEVSCDESLL